jgi:hypothetical protein
MSKFKVIKDIYFLDKKIFSLGDFTELTDGFISLKTEEGVLNIEYEKIKDSLIKENEIYSFIEEIPLEEDSQEKNFRIQLDIVTTKEKIVQIDAFIREYLNNLI